MAFEKIAKKTDVLVADLRADGLDRARVPLPTHTGDVTVHCSCTLHMSQPPVERERRVAYTGFGLAERERASADRARALSDIGHVREGAYKTVSQAPGYTGAR